MFVFCYKKRLLILKILYEILFRKTVPSMTLKTVPEAACDSGNCSVNCLCGENWRKSTSNEEEKPEQKF